MRRRLNHVSATNIGPRLWVGIVAATLTSALPAKAHGPAPVVLEVLDASEERPTLLRTSVGLAFAASDGSYVYGCPSAWSGNELAPVHAASESLLGALDGNIAFVSTDEGCTFEPLRAWVLAMASSPGRLWVASDASLLSIGDGMEIEVVAELDGEVQDLAVGEERIVAVGRDLGLWSADLNGEAQLHLPLPADASRWTVRAIGDREVYLASTLGGRTLHHLAGSRWEDLRAEETLRGNEVHGPVALGEYWLVIVDNRLMRRVKGSAAPWEELGEVDYTCLSAFGDRAYACSLGGLFELGGGGEEETLVFRFTQLGAPRTSCGDVRACESDWAHFGGESGWLESGPAEAPGAERTTSAGGCSIGGSGASGIGIALGCLLMWRRACHRCW